MSAAGSRRRVVVATCDTITQSMAGPAIRSWEMAAALSLEHEVQLVTTSRATVSDDRFRVRSVDNRALRQLEKWCDIFIFQGWVITGRPFLLNSEKVLVADLYDPLHLEQLEQARDDGEEERAKAVAGAVAVLNEQMLRGDYFLCANARQRDFWLGQLAGLGRINPVTYDEDETLESLLRIVPFGVSATPPVATRSAVKGVLPGIGRDDKLILWGGGIYNWLDPLTLLRAMDRVRERVPNCRLLFMGLKHPNPEIPTMQMAVEARALSDSLGLTGTHVFFNEGWVDYDDRQNYLLEADIGVSTHLAHLESAMSSRTRILDYIWAGLPVVATSGDSLSAVVESRGVGVTVPPGDVDALANALLHLVEDEVAAKTCAANAAALTPELAWPRVLEPLVELCRNPRRAPDVLNAESVEARKAALLPPRRAWHTDLGIAWSHLRSGGPTQLARKARSRLRHQLSKRA